METKSQNLIPVTDWPNHYSWPPVGGLRHLIFHSATRYSSKGALPGNGLVECGALVRCGRRVLINPEKFFRWIEQQQDGKESVNKAGVQHDHK